MSELVDLARRVAAKAHGDGLDEAGQPMVAHLERVADRVDGERERVVAWLHHVVAAKGWGSGDVIAKGIPSELARAVVAVSRHDDDDPSAYAARLAANPLARAVTEADVADMAEPERVATLDPAARARLGEACGLAQRALDGS